MRLKTRPKKKKKFNVLCVSYINTNSLSFWFVVQTNTLRDKRGQKETKRNLLGGFFFFFVFRIEINLLVDGQKRGAKATDRNLQEIN